MAPSLVYVTYVVASVVVVLFGAAACFLTFVRQGLIFLSLGALTRSWAVAKGSDKWRAILAPIKIGSKIFAGTEHMAQTHQNSS